MSAEVENYLQSGDRLEIAVEEADLAQDQLRVEASFEFLLGGSAAGTVVLVGEGQEVEARYERTDQTLRGANLARLVSLPDPGRLYLELVTADPLCFRLVAESLPRVSPEYGQADPPLESGVRLRYDPADWELVQEHPERRPAGEAAFDLSRRAAQFATTVGFDRLISLPLLRDVEPYEHQLKTVQTVLRRFRGQALLCDEVGLGKTIEAGMVLLELLVRQLVHNVLILTPPSLVEQWQDEMRRKFGLDCITHDDPTFREKGAQAWTHFDRIIASYHTAKREPHRSRIQGREWDLVIIDEAHHFRNRTTLLWKFASPLRKKYILLLTATPVQNNLEELFNLVTLLKPGLLSTARSFQRQFVDRKDKLTPRNLGQLRELLTEAMVRNRRASVALRFTRRYARTEGVHPSASEQELYQQVTRFVKDHLRGPGVLSRMALVTLQKEMGSSSQAAGPTLARLAETDRLEEADRQRLAELARAAQAQEHSAKAERLLALLQEFPDQMVIFTQFRQTQEFLHRLLLERGESVALFHGGLSRLQKEEAIRAFRTDTRLLLSTESGGEGRNLQFCNALCNFDLPWNPMRIEQRVGRLSRIGQTRDVYIFNLVSVGTLEAYVLYLLEAKINLFELVIGEIDMILGNLEEEQEFEDLLLDLWVDSEDDAVFRQQLEHLGDRLAAAKENYLRQQEYDDELFGDRFSPMG